MKTTSGKVTVSDKVNKSTGGEEVRMRGAGWGFMTSYAEKARALNTVSNIVMSTPSNKFAAGVRGGQVDPVQDAEGAEGV